MLAAQAHAREVHQRLRNPPNAVPDNGIDLRRKVIPIAQIQEVQEVTIITIDRVDEKIMAAKQAVPAVFRLPDVSLIQMVTAEHFGLDRDQLLAKRRLAHLVWPRQVAMYLSKLIAGASYPSIGLRFGGRDHTTAIHAVRKVEKLRSEDLALDAELSQLEAKIREQRVFPT